MSLTIEEIYEAVKPLPAGEKLKLARRLLNDIPSESVGDYSEAWSEEDLREATGYSLHLAKTSMGPEEDNV